MADLARMRAILIARELRAVVTAAVGERRVRTPAGAAHYGQPINSVIRRDIISVANGVLKQVPSAPKTPKGKVSSSSPPRPVRDRTIRAYPTNARTPDGRVILTDEQMKDFKVSTEPHSMLAYVEDVVVNGKTVKALSKEREAIHDELVQMIVGGVKLKGGKKREIFIGGGTGSGKSSATKNMAGYPRTRDLKDTDIKPPGEAVLIDSDAIKVALPEWDSLDPKRAAAFMHEESSMLAKQAQAVAISRGLDIVADGTGDNSPASMLKKVNQAKADGYYTQGLYITAPAGETIVRSIQRGIQTGRHVPLGVLMNIHRDVTTTTEGMSDQYDRYDLFDTDVPEGAPAVPIVINGRVVDQRRFDEYTAKKDVTDLQAAEVALQRAEAKSYKPVKVGKTGEVWPAERVKQYTIGHIRRLIFAIGDDETLPADSML